mmetsp:Transcript_24786/g.57766  ORF Transcript_24786/g.57766 Transcript_24786/m.57766 type:complete len:310 (-) Transcript_24786:2380-3309(-)
MCCLSSVGTHRHTTWEHPHIRCRGKGRWRAWRGAYSATPRIMFANTPGHVRYVARCTSRRTMRDFWPPADATCCTRHIVTKHIHVQRNTTRERRAVRLRARPPSHRAPHSKMPPPQASSPETHWRLLLLSERGWPKYLLLPTPKAQRPWLTLARTRLARCDQRTQRHTSRSTALAPDRTMPPATCGLHARGCTREESQAGAREAAASTQRAPERMPHARAAFGSERASRDDHVAAVDESTLLVERQRLDAPMHPVEHDRTRHKIGRLGARLSGDFKGRHRSGCRLCAFDCLAERGGDGRSRRGAELQRL